MPQSQTVLSRQGLDVFLHNQAQESSLPLGRLGTEVSTGGNSGRGDGDRSSIG